MNYYSIYGFTVRSEFELPELREINMEIAESSIVGMVEIVAGSVPASLPNETRIADWVSYSGTSCLYIFSGIVRILVEDGRRIVVDMEQETCESDMRTFLMGSGLGTITHMRGMIPLHVSAVLSPVGAIAFTGPSGAGKSTLAATINAELGWPLVTDDVAILKQVGERIEIEGGVNRCRLWQDALDRLNISTAGLVPDMQRLEKYQVISPELFVDGSNQLVALVDLAPEAQNDLVAIKGVDRFITLSNSIYRPFLVRPFQTEKNVSQKLLAACNHLEVWSDSNYRKVSSSEFAERIVQLLM